MNKEELMELGVEEELAKKIIIMHGKSIESFKTTNAELQAKIDELTAENETALTKLKEFEELDVDGIAAKAEKYKAEAEEARQQAESKIIELRYDHSLEKALVKHKAKNVTAVKALLNQEELKLAEDGTIEGLEEQLKSIKSENDFLFDSEKADPKIVVGSNNTSQISDTAVDAARRAANLG